MNQLKRLGIWLSRIHRCRGFGIQSPTDYSFVRYVVNEHWPYYAYAQLPLADWLTTKLGRLYFRLANWRQPRVMQTDAYAPYWQAGCQRLQLTEAVPSTVELARVPVEDHSGCEALLARCDEHSLLVVEGIWRDWGRWQAVERDDRTGTTFDLYYCGIVLFDKNRHRHHYKVNF